MHSTATDRRSASKCQAKRPDQTLDQAFRLPEVLLAVSTSRLSCKRAGKTRTLIPVRDSAGESRDAGGYHDLRTPTFALTSWFLHVLTRSGDVRRNGWLAHAEPSLCRGPQHRGSDP